MAELKSGTSVSSRSEEFTEFARFGSSLVVFVLGALMMAEGVVKTVAGTAILFFGVDPGFEFTIGFIVVVISASIMSLSRRFSGGRR